MSRNIILYFMVCLYVQFSRQTTLNSINITYILEALPCIYLLICEAMFQYNLYVHHQNLKSRFNGSSLTSFKSKA
jgi:high-affinity K+ transport system ATPase subunit B